MISAEIRTGTHSDDKTQSVNYPKKWVFAQNMHSPKVDLSLTGKIKVGLVENSGFITQDGIDTANAIEDRYKPIRKPETSFGETAPLSSRGSINFDSDLVRIRQIEESLGIKEGQRLAHNPAHERARYERAKNGIERSAIKDGIIVNAEKTLYELARTDQSTVEYRQDEGGQVYHPSFPGEPFLTVLQRGVENSKKNGYADYEREVVELEGLKSVLAHLFSPDVPLESKEVVISGPGLIKGTAFTDNFVDIFTKRLDPVAGEIIVTMTRFASGSNYKEYEKIVKKLNPNYFKLDKPEKGKEDLFYKENSLFIDSRLDSRSPKQIFAEEFTGQKGVSEEERTRGHLDECRLFILHYADQLCAGFFDPQKVNKAFNAMVNKFDELRRGIAHEVSKGIGQVKDFIGSVTSFVQRGIKESSDFMKQVEYYAIKKMEEMIGCGFLTTLSVNLSVGQVINKGIDLARSAGRLLLGGGISEKNKWLCKQCGACGAVINCEVRPGERCPTYPKCKAIRKCA